MISQTHAISVLMECTGRDIWSIETCVQKRIPEDWINELKDCFESGFLYDQQKIFHKNELINQFEGVFDRDLAIKIAQFLGVHVDNAIATALSPAQEVAALKEAIIEL